MSAKAEDKGADVSIRRDGDTGPKPAPSPAPQPAQECRHIDIATFKTRQCKIREPHLPKRCPYYHDARKDRRRPPSHNYAAEMCVYALNEKDCPYGDSCQNAHNRVEEFYHPSKYKTKFCTTYPNGVANCEYGDFCCFAHSEQDIKIDLLHRMERDSDFYMFHFKTVWCPFNETNHARDQCVYAHNWQDFRRKPHVYPYEKSQCANWDLSKIINVYYDGCGNGMPCRYSHGWKEQEYHPLAYKTNHCRHGESCSKLHCPFYHSEKDRRTPVTQFFVYTPRTRVFTFHVQRSNYEPPALQTSVYMVQPSQPPAFVGSPMEGLHYSPVGSPNMGPSSLILECPPLSHSPATGSPVGSPGGMQFMQHSYPDRTNSPGFGPRPHGPGFAEVTFFTGNMRAKDKCDSIMSMVTESFVKEPIPPIQPSPKISFTGPQQDSTRKQQRAQQAQKSEEKPRSPSDYLSDLPTLTKDTLQFLRSGSDDEEDKEEPIEADPLLAFLRENNLKHLYKNFAQFGITGDSVFAMTDVSLEQLGITGEDKRKILLAIQRENESSNRAYDSVKELS